MKNRYLYIHGSRHSGSGALIDFLLCSKQVEFVDTFIPWEIIKTYKGLNLTTLLAGQTDAIKFIYMIIYELKRFIILYMKSIIIIIVRKFKKDFKLRKYTITSSRVPRDSYRYHLTNVYRLIKFKCIKNNSEYILQSYFDLLDKFNLNENKTYVFDAISSEINVITALNQVRESDFIFVHRNIIDQLTQMSVLDNNYLVAKNLLLRYENAKLALFNFDLLSKRNNKVLCVDFDELIDNQNYRIWCIKNIGLKPINTDGCSTFNTKLSQNNRKELRNSKEYNIVINTINSSNVQLNT